MNDQNIIKKLLAKIINCALFLLVLSYAICKDTNIEYYTFDHHHIWVQISVGSTHLTIPNIVLLSNTFSVKYFSHNESLFLAFQLRWLFLSHIIIPCWYISNLFLFFSSPLLHACLSRRLRFRIHINFRFISSLLGFLWSTTNEDTNLSLVYQYSHSWVSSVPVCVCVHSRMNARVCVFWGCVCVIDNMYSVKVKQICL